MSPDSAATRPLDGLRIVSLAINLPGPAAAARLAELGAHVTKIEPPSGDPLALGAPDYYRQLVGGQQVVTLDLKDAAARESLWNTLAESDLLLTSSRPSALARLGLDWSSLHARLPQLSQVAIVGHPGPEAEIAGHDLTYQATVGTLSPPQLPIVPIADLAGAERAVADGVAALLFAQRTGAGSYREVALSDVAATMAQPAKHGLTTRGGILSGALPQYSLYAASDGFVALAALEAHFWTGLLEQLRITGTPAELVAVFKTRSAAEWEAWGHDHGLPIAAVRS
ncbi:CoA transferase [Calidifontibacter terrae]